MFGEWITRNARLLAAFCLLGAAPLLAYAGPGHHHDACPECGTAVCLPSIGVVKEKHHRWEVECKQICVPHIRWPWQPCCELPKCGHVKNVKVLKRIEYECEKCGCKWDVKCDGCCPDGSCR